MREEKLRTMEKSASPEQTYNLAKELVKMLQERRSFIIGIEGDLGAGKTVFVRGIVEALGGDPNEVTSPTFVIMQTYNTEKGIVYHFDWYRLNSPEELRDFGWMDLLCQRESFLVIEWADRFKEYLPEDTVWVNIKHQSFEERIVEISFPGSSIG